MHLFLTKSQSISFFGNIANLRQRSTVDLLCFAQKPAGWTLEQCLDMACCRLLQCNTCDGVSGGNYKWSALYKPPLLHSQNRLGAVVVSRTIGTEVQLVQLARYSQVQAGADKGRRLWSRPLLLTDEESSYVYDRVHALLGGKLLRASSDILNLYSKMLSAFIHTVNIH